VSAISFLLLPIYIRHLSTQDYGALALLIAVEAVSKIAFRWGLDGAFMRYYHDPPGGDVQRLASTLFLFLGGASGVLLAAALVSSHRLAQHLFGGDEYLLPLRLVLVNAFILTFTFLPFHVMRMRGQAVAFSAFALARSTLTLLLRLTLVVWAGWGLLGIAVADVMVTTALVPLLWPWWRHLLGGQFSRGDLRLCLRFGLPRLPHGLAQQALDSGNKYLLSQHVSLSGLGVYQIGSTIGQSLKFFLSAFETGWAPFYYQTARQPDAAEVFRKTITYGLALLLLLLAGITAIAGDLVLLMTNQAYESAAIVVPLIALGIVWQGVYLLTSIGLNLTSQTRYYPVSTMAAAGIGLGSGAILMPRFGAVGAAIAFVLSYVTLALVAFHFSRRYYPIRLEIGRIVRLVVAATIAAAAGTGLPDVSPLTGVVLRGTVVVAVFLGLLWGSGFLRASERAVLGILIARFRRGPKRPQGISHTAIDEVQPGEARVTMDD
jgi:O-antigen/teichoic acid export membrane protein